MLICVISSTMNKKYKHFLTVFLGALVAGILSGVGGAYLWQHYSYRFGGGGFLGPSSGELGAVVYGLFGFSYGIISGGIAGGLIVGFRLGKIKSTIVGIIAGSIIPLMILGADEANVSRAIKKISQSSMPGQIAMGGLAGLVVSVLNDSFNRQPRED